jgi:2-C-methyl-D-erythritol 4-phosphate cytidylyltransferase
MKHDSIAAIIVAGGAGARLGSSTPKGFVALGDKPLFLHSLEVLLHHGAIREALLVIPAGFESYARIILREAGCTPRVSIIVGGKERWQSVQNGVNATSAHWVLVHDAARPFVTNAVIDAVLAKRAGFDCVITATPEVDTIRMHAGDLAGEVIDRSKLVRIGTPQLFKRSALLEAFKIPSDLATPPTDEAVLMQRMGIPVGIASGDPANFKITTPTDFAIAEAFLAHRRTM